MVFSRRWSEAEKRCIGKRTRRAVQRASVANDTPPPGHISQEEAARRLGISYDAVGRRARAGAFGPIYRMTGPFLPRGRNWLSEAAVQAYGFSLLAKLQRKLRHLSTARRRPPRPRRRGQ